MRSQRDVRPCPPTSLKSQQRGSRPETITGVSRALTGRKHLVPDKVTPLSDAAMLSQPLTRMLSLYTVRSVFGGTDPERYGTA